MKRVRRLTESFLELEPETVEAHRPAARRFKRRRRVDALVVTAALAEKERQRLGRHLREFQQELLPADLRERRDFLLGAHRRHVVRVLAVQPNQIAPRGAGERRLREELWPRETAVPRHQPVVAEMIPVEEDRRPEIELLKDVAVEELTVARDVDAELLDETLRGVAVRVRRRNPLRAAVADEGPSLL